MLELLLRLRLVFPMALSALEHRDVTEIDWMLEWLVRLMAELAFAVGERAQINGMDKRPCLHRRFRIGRVINHRVTNVAVIRDDLSFFADVVAVVTAEAA